MFDRGLLMQEITRNIIRNTTSTLVLIALSIFCISTRSIHLNKGRGLQNFSFDIYYYTDFFCVGSSLSRVSSSSPSSTTPTEAETGPQSYHSPAHATSSEIEDEAPPPVASRPERTKSIVSVYLFFTTNYFLPF